MPCRPTLADPARAPLARPGTPFAASLGVSSAVFLAVFLAISVAAAAPSDPQVLQTSAAHAILLDAATRTVLFERGADDAVTPASTAKLMTAEIVFELLRTGKLRPDQQFTVSETAWRQGGAPSRGSTMFAKLGSAIAVDDLLHGLIIDSANDAAIVLAEGVAGSQGAFATLMTNRARELGFSHLTFTDAWGGPSPDQKVTAREMAFLAGHIIEAFPDRYRLFGERDFTWNRIKQPNRNPLLAMDVGADGLKTGNIDNSGFSIVGSAVQNNQRLIVAIYGAGSAKERSEEARKILQWGFRSFEMRHVFAAGDRVGAARVYGGEARDVALVTDKAIDVLVPREAGERLTARIAYKGPLMAPVAADATVGELKLLRGDREVLSTPLRTSRAVAVGSLPRRALDAGLEFVGGLFRKYVSHS